MTSLNKVNWPLDSRFLEEFANFDGLRAVCLTFDHDWTPDYMVRHVMALLAPYKVKATFLATGPCESLLNGASGHEVGLHLNLAPNSTQGKDIHEMVEKLRTLYPDAQGNRFHLLGHAYRDLMALGKMGLKYDISSLRLNVPYLLPAFHPDLDMTLLSYCWEDGLGLEGGALPVDRDTLDLDSPGVKILNFHPINVYLNLRNENDKRAFFADAGNLTTAPEEIAKRHRNTGRGIETLLIDILEELKSRGSKVATAAILAREFTAARQRLVD